MPLDILIVDDEKEIQDIIAAYLISHDPNHTIITAQSVEEAFVRILNQDYNFKIAYLDQNLPGLEGIKLGKHLKEKNPEMEIAMITAAPSPDLKEKSAELGLKFIEKPFRLEQITSLLEAYQEKQPSLPQEPSLHLSLNQNTREIIYQKNKLPQVSERIKRRLTESTLHYLNKLAFEEYTEENRVFAYTGLVAALRFDIKLPKQKGKTFFQVYDSLMEKYGLKKEFS